MKQYTLDEFREHYKTYLENEEAFEVTYNTKPYVRISYDTTSNLARVLRNSGMKRSLMWISGLEGASREGMQTFSIVLRYIENHDKS